MGRTIEAAIAMGIRGEELLNLRRQIKAEAAQIHETKTRTKNRRKNKQARASRRRNRR